MTWNANDASRQAAQQRTQRQQQRSHRRNQQRAARQMKDLVAQYRLRKSSFRQQRVHEQPDGVLEQSEDSVPRSGGRSKAVLVACVFIGGIAAVIAALGFAVL